VRLGDLLLWVPLWVPLAWATCSGAPAYAHEARTAKIVEIVDCDTYKVAILTLAVDGGREIQTFNWTVRLRGVSAPEATGPEAPLGKLCVGALRGWMQEGDLVTLVGPFSMRDPRSRLVAAVRLGYALPWDYPRERRRPAFDQGAVYPIEVSP
jgi:endonuclease YncB( thermonuclease family)